MQSTVMSRGRKRTRALATALVVWFAMVVLFDVTVPGRRLLERLARYLARPPVSLQRMEWDREKGEVLYRTGRGHAEERGSDQERADDVRNDVERIDELEFLARVVTQLPAATRTPSGNTATTPRS